MSRSPFLTARVIHPASWFIRSRQVYKPDIRVPLPYRTFRVHQFHLHPLSRARTPVAMAGWSRSLEAQAWANFLKRCVLNGLCAVPLHPQSSLLTRPNRLTDRRGHCTVRRTSPPLCAREITLTRFLGHPLLPTRLPSFAQPEAQAKR